MWHWGRIFRFFPAWPPSIPYSEKGKDLFESWNRYNPQYNIVLITFSSLLSLLFHLGVFTTCVMNMVGVVIFLRSGWMVVSYIFFSLKLLLKPKPV